MLILFFLVENGRLHAVDQVIANLRKDKADPKQVLNLLQNALSELISFAKGKIPPHFIEMGETALSENTNDQSILTSRIEQIFTHLPHHDRIQLSTLIHHAQAM